MFSAHNINNNTLSIKNLILLFLTIVLGFASVITLAQLTIPSSIDNAHQTIGRVTITSDGTANGITFRDFNDAGNGKTYITGLIDQGSFSGKILGIDENGYLVYAYSTNLIISGSTGGGGGGGDNHRTGDNTAHIRNLNSGNIGIGNTSPTSGKLHITSSAQTELYLQEINNGNAANINLKNVVNTRMIGGFSHRFYIGLEGTAFINITSGGRVGIGTTGPKANLQVIGNFIAGDYSNDTHGSAVSVAGGSGNLASGDYNFVGGGEGNNAGYSSLYPTLNGSYNVIGGGKDNTTIKKYSVVVGGKNNIAASDYSFIGGGGGNTITGNVVIGDFASIVGGNGNTINNAGESFIGGGRTNFIGQGSTRVANVIVGGAENTIGTGVSNSFIGGGQSNTISGGGGNYSFIGGGFNNFISGAYSFAGGTYARALHNNTFVRNTVIGMNFDSTKPGQFIINVPFEKGVRGGVGINTKNPQSALDVSGDIRGQTIFGDRLDVNTGEIVGGNLGLSNSPINTGSICVGEEGKIIYKSGSFYGCDGTNRKQLNN